MVQALGPQFKENRKLRNTQLIWNKVILRTGEILDSGNFVFTDFMEYLSSNPPGEFDSLANIYNN
jgi:hypothetical protein